MTRVVALAVACLAVVLAACSGGDDEPSTSAVSASPSASASAPSSPPSSGSAVASSTATLAGSVTSVPATEESTTAPTSAPTRAAATPTTAPQPAATATSAPQPSTVSISLTAANLAFDKATVHVPAGATVTASFTNADAGVEHNLTFSLPGLPHGDTCTGPCSTSQVFQAPSASGSYFFLCTIHPMSGALVVDP